jgi:site-specific recombinase XerD
MNCTVVPNVLSLNVRNLRGESSALLLRDFDEFLSRVRGLTRGSRERYCFYVRRFLASVCGGAAPDWSSMRGEDFAAFVQREASRLKRNANEGPGTAIRALLRYLTFTGAIPAGMEAAVPRMRRWKHAALPRYLSLAEIERVVAGVLDNSLTGQRDHAILLLLARTGLRAAEVAQLTLDDIDWMEGILHIRSAKSRCERSLPLATDVGAALCVYLERGRPRSAYRVVFLRAVPPFVPFPNRAGVCKIARRALKRARIVQRPIGTHLFRHSAATGMLRGGASFKEIADVLGHKSLDTTTIYAKLDLPALARVSLPWPRSAL